MASATCSVRFITFKEIYNSGYGRPDSTWPSLVNSANTIMGYIYN